LIKRKNKENKMPVSHKGTLEKRLRFSAPRKLEQFSWVAVDSNPAGEISTDG